MQHCLSMRKQRPTKTQLSFLSVLSKPFSLPYSGSPWAMPAWHTANVVNSTGEDDITLTMWMSQVTWSTALSTCHQLQRHPLTLEVICSQCLSEDLTLAPLESFVFYPLLYKQLKFFEIPHLPSLPSILLLNFLALPHTSLTTKVFNNTAEGWGPQLG